MGMTSRIELFGSTDNPINRMLAGVNVDSVRDWLVNDLGWVVLWESSGAVQLAEEVRLREYVVMLDRDVGAKAHSLIHAASCIADCENVRADTVLQKFLDLSEEE